MPRPNLKQARKKKSILNPDRSRSTERSITVGDKETGYVNIPTIYQGKQLTPRQAVARAKRAGFRGRKRYKTIKAAVRDARMRSQALGRLGSGIP